MKKRTAVILLLMPMLTLFFSGAECFAYRLTASSYENEDLSPAKAMDNNPKSRWSSDFSDPQWLMIDLGAPKEFVGLEISWEAAFSNSYDILISQDAKNWTKLFSEKTGDGSIDDIYFGKKKARYIKLDGHKRGTAWGYSIWEIKIKDASCEIKSKASAEKQGYGASKALDGDKNTSWHSGKLESADIEFSFPKAVSYGSVNVNWGKDRPSSFAASVSYDNKSWRKVLENSDSGKSDTDKIEVNLAGIRALKIDCRKSRTQNGFSIKEITFKDWEERAVKNNLDMTRSIVGWENYWWVSYVGRDGSFSPEPMPYKATFWVRDNSNGMLYTPETQTTDWQLHDGRNPVSIVTWESGGIQSETSVFAKLDKVPFERLITYVRNTIKNASGEEKNLTVFLAVRPSPISFKWNQSLKNVGYNGKDAVKINGKDSIFFKTPSTKTPDLNDFVFEGASLMLPQRQLVTGGSEKGGVLPFLVKLKPGEEKSLDFFALAGEQGAVSPQKILALNYDKAYEEVVNYWANRAPIKIELPEKVYADCFYSSLNYMLILMKNGELFPGAYNYKTFFLHDAVEMAGALDKAGLHKETQDTIAKFDYNGNQYLDELGGNVFVYYEHYRLNKDKDFLRRMYPKMITKCRLGKQLRSKQLTNQLRNTEFFGLMPQSVSQDNFKYPAYLYVDNWWTLLGYKAAIESAKILGNNNDIGWLQSEYDALLDATLASIKKVTEREGGGHMVGFADDWPPEHRVKDLDHRILGETQKAWAHRSPIFPGLSMGMQIPLDLFEKSYRYYWDVAGKFSNYDGGWYVEYETLFWGYNVQLAHPMMFLNMEEVTLKNIKWSLENQSCPGGWCEAMNTKEDENGYRVITDGIVGDVPHGWTASYYIHLLRNMLIYEDAPNERLELIRCVPAEWLKEGKVINIQNAPTFYGYVSFKTEGISGNKLKVTIDAKTPPEGGYLIKVHKSMNISSVSADGVQIDDIKANEVIVPKSSKEVIVNIK